MIPGDDPPWLEGAGDTVKAVYRFWQEKCRDGRLPRRADIDPVELPTALLPLISLVEPVDDERRYVYRLVGTREVDMRGRDPTGKSVIENYFGLSVESSVVNYDKVMATGQPQYDDSHFTSPDGRYIDEADLYLPLSDDGIQINRILVLAVYGPGPKHPSRLLPAKE